jgi:hypothetical protein
LGLRRVSADFWGPLSQVIRNAAAGTLFIFESQDPDAAWGPDIDLNRNSASPAASDLLAGLLFNGKDSGGNKKLYAAVRATIISSTAGAEASDLALRSIVAGILADRMHIRAGAYMEGATGGDPGAVEFNAVEVQQNGVKLPSVNEVLGGTWQTVTRAHNTAYQNTLSKPITVTYELSYTQSNTAALDVSDNGTTWLSFGSSRVG